MKQPINENDPKKISSSPIDKSPQDKDANDALISPHHARYRSPPHLEILEETTLFFESINQIKIHGT